MKSLILELTVKKVVTILIMHLKRLFAVAKKECEKGIVICGTGIGVSIVANKVHGIRCALVHDVFSAKATRQHNDTNMMAMGARVIGEGLAN